MQIENVMPHSCRHHQTDEEKATVRLIDGNNKKLLN